MTFHREYYDTASIYSGNREGPVLGEINPPSFKGISKASKLSPVGSSDIEAYATLPRWQALGLDGPKSPKDKLNAFEQLAELKQTKRTPILPSYAEGDLNKQRELVDNVFKKNLGPEGRYFMNRIKNNSAKESWKSGDPTPSAIHTNSKTGLSMDFSTDCPERMAPCPYCYVEHGRGAFKEFNMHGANKTLVESPYRREILAMPEDVVNLTNSQGGLRAHSFGDYRPVQDYNNWKLALQDAEMKGLYIKAITKQPEFVHAFGDHPNLRVNISIDALPREMSNAPTFQEAMSLKAGKDNIKIRSVALTEAQGWEQAKNPNISVVTLYHTALGPENLMKTIKTQSPGLIKKVGEKNLWNEIKTWENMPRNSKAFKRLEEAFPNKICCQSGKCGQDPTKCGFGINAAGGLLAGVILPEVSKEKEPDSNSSGGYQADDGGL